MINEYLENLSQLADLRTQLLEKSSFHVVTLPGRASPSVHYRPLKNFYTVCVSLNSAIQVNYEIGMSLDNI